MRKLFLLFLFLPSFVYGQSSTKVDALPRATTWTDSSLFYFEPDSTDGVLRGRKLYFVDLMKRLPFTNIDNYGATGDGSIDDSDAFDSTMAALGDSGGVIGLTAGKVYKLNSITIDKSNLIIKGVGGYGIVQKGSSNTLFINDSTAIRQNIVFENIRFTDISDFGGAFVLFVKMVNVVFDNCIFEYPSGSAKTPDATGIYRTNGKTFINCTFKNIFNTAIAGSSGPVSLGYEGDHPVANYPKFTAIANKFYNVRKAIIHDLDDTESATSNPRDSSFATIIGNVGYGTGTGQFIGLQHMSKAIVTNNVGINFKNGIDAETIDEAIISNNYLQGSSTVESGIRVATTNLDTSMYKLTITGNQIYDFSGSGIGMSGIKADSSEFFVISDNIIGRCKQDGIYIDDFRHGLITNNIIFDNNRGLANHGGIRFGVGSVNEDITISNNIFKNTQKTISDTTMTYGIVFQGTNTGMTVLNNRFYNMRTGDIFGTPQFDIGNYSDTNQHYKIATKDSIIMSISTSGKNMHFNTTNGIIYFGKTSNYTKAKITSHTSAGTPGKGLYVYNDAGSNASAGVLFGTAANDSNAIIVGGSESATEGLLELWVNDSSTLTRIATISDDGLTLQQGYLRKYKVSAPLTPSFGQGVTWWGTDGKYYGKNDAGTAYDLTAGGQSIPYLTRQISFPDTIKNNQEFWLGFITDAIVPDSVYAFIKGGTSVSINIEVRSDTAPTTTGTNMLTTNFTVTTTGQYVSNFASASYARLQNLWLVIKGAPTGTPILIGIAIWGTKQ